MRSRNTLLVTLTDHPEARFTVSGDSSLHLYGDKPIGRDVHAVWYALDHMSRDEFDAIVARYAIGGTLELRGYWKPFKGNSRTSFTFVAQFVKALDLCRAPMRANLPTPKSPRSMIDAQ